MRFSFNARPQMMPCMAQCMRHVSPYLSTRMLAGGHHEVRRKPVDEEEWAHEVDITHTVPDFREKVPVMAKEVGLRSARSSCLVVLCAAAPVSGHVGVFLLYGDVMKCSHTQPKQTGSWPAPPSTRSSWTPSRSRPSCTLRTTTASLSPRTHLRARRWWQSTPSHWQRST